MNQKMINEKNDETKETSGFHKDRAARRGCFEKFRNIASYGFYFTIRSVVTARGKSISTATLWSSVIQTG